MGRWSVKWEWAPQLQSCVLTVLGHVWHQCRILLPRYTALPFGFSQLLGASLCPTLTSALSLAQGGESPRCVQVSAKITVTQWLSVTAVQLLSSTLPFLLVLKGGTGRNRTWGPITEVPPLPSLHGNQCDVCAPKRVCSDPNLEPMQPQGVRAKGVSRKTISLTAAGDKLGKESRKCTWFLKPKKLVHRKFSCSPCSTVEENLQVSLGSLFWKEIKLSSW